MVKTLSLACFQREHFEKPGLEKRLLVLLVFNPLSIVHPPPSELKALSLACFQQYMRKYVATKLVS